MLVRQHDLLDEQQHVTHDAKYKLLTHSEVANEGIPGGLVRFILLSRGCVLLLLLLFRFVYLFMIILGILTLFND